MPRNVSQTCDFRALLLGSFIAAGQLGVVGGWVRAIAVQVNQESKAPATTVSNPTTASPGRIEGRIFEPDGKPVAGAFVVVVFGRTGKSNHQVLRTESSGSFTYSIPAREEWLYFVAHKDGFSPAFWDRPIAAGRAGDPLERKLGTSGPFSARLVNSAGKPIVGAKIRVEGLAHVSQTKDGDRTYVTTWYDRVRREILAGSPLERLFEATTDTDGSFDFAALERESALMLGATSVDGHKFRIRTKIAANESTRRGLEEEGFVTAAPGEKATLAAVPEALVAGRVVTKLPGVSVAGLTASFQTTTAYRAMTSFAANNVLTDTQGRFSFEGLNDGSVNVFVHGEGESKDWTYAAAKDVILTAGATSQVTIELIRGVVVQGTIVAKETGTPLEGAVIAARGPFRPRTGAATEMTKTDAQGRYRFRLPPGETDFVVPGPLSGQDSKLTVTIPSGPSNYEVPAIKVRTDPTVVAQVLDTNDMPVVGATVVGAFENGILRPFGGAGEVTDARGEFVLPPDVYKIAASGGRTRLLIRLRDGAEHEAAITLGADRAITIKLPVGGY
jgi:uncharacterized GH25 family protein